MTYIDIIRRETFPLKSSYRKWPDFEPWEGHLGFGDRVSIHSGKKKV